MTPEKLSQVLYEIIAVENLNMYRRLFTDGSVETYPDPYWKEALTLFGALSDTQKEIFFKVIRQISIDTTSNILGIIDGVSGSAELKASLELTSDGCRLDGDLQEFFLAESERREDD
jgi:hypothetical protein